MNSYQFTNTWFQNSKPTWDLLIPNLNPTTILEVGSYEGASTCYLIDNLSNSKNLEIHCVDTWEGGIEHQIGEVDMNLVEKRFLHNTNLSISNSVNKVNLISHKGYSDRQLSKIFTEKGSNYFDFIYIDGSHQAPDVLCDAVLGFKLLKKFGLIIFDDYLWSEDLTYGIDPIRSPKLAIDSFTNIYCRQIKILQAPLYQIYIQKLSD
jgi:predicted O-methyltransferase YrrM